MHKSALFLLKIYKNRKTPNGLRWGVSNLSLKIPGYATDVKDVSSIFYYKIEGSHSSERAG